MYAVSNTVCCLQHREIGVWVGWPLKAAETTELGSLHGACPGEGQKYQRTRISSITLDTSDMHVDAVL